MIVGILIVGILKPSRFFKQNRETKVYTGARAFNENTKTVLAGCLKLFQNFLSPIWHSEGPKYGYFGGKNRAIMTGWLQGNVSAWKLFYAPYHISLYGQT